MREINAENLITVTYETYAVAQRKPEKIQLCLPGLDPWPLRYQCSALTNWARSQLQGWSSNWFVIYATCTSLIMHLICPPPPNILHNLCFSFLQGITSLRTADVFPVVASLPPKKREEMTGNTSAARLLGYYSRPKRNWKQYLRKILGGK